MGNQDYSAWYWWKVDNDGHDDHLVFMIIWLRYNFNTSTSNIYNVQIIRKQLSINLFMYIKFKPHPTLIVIRWDINIVKLFISMLKLFINLYYHHPLLFNKRRNCISDVFRLEENPKHQERWWPRSLKNGCECIL